MSVWNEAMALLPELPCCGLVSLMMPPSRPAPPSAMACVEPPNRHMALTVKATIGPRGTVFWSPLPQTDEPACRVSEPAAAGVAIDRSVSTGGQGRAV